MPDITRDDLKIVLAFGIHIAKIDDDFAVWEKRILARFAEAISLTEEERAELANTKVSLSDGLDRLSSQDAKYLLLKTLCAVSHSDGEAHQAEIDFISRVFAKLGDQMFMLPRNEWGVYEGEVFGILEALSP